MKKLLTLLFCMFAFMMNVFAEDTYLFKINTDGYGEFAVAKEGEELKFDEDYPVQTAFYNTEPGSKFEVVAKAGEGWKFVKWLMNEDDYSTDEKIIVTVDKNMDLLAVFDVDGDTESDVIITSDEGEDIATPSEDKSNTMVYYGIAGFAVILALVLLAVLNKKNNE